MLTRRDFMQVTAATAAMFSSVGSIGAAASDQKITQEQLLQFDSVGQVTLLNFTDIHAQLVPLYFREPSVNLGVGNAYGLPPHLTGKDFLKHFNKVISFYCNATLRWDIWPIIRNNFFFIFNEF